MGKKGHFYGENGKWEIFNKVYTTAKLDDLKQLYMCLIAGVLFASESKMQKEAGKEVAQKGLAEVFADRWGHLYGQGVSYRESGHLQDLDAM